MEREEIKQKLYNVAEIIRNNADKFANGEILTNEDWLQCARDFNACMNYLANSDDFEGTRKDIEPLEMQKPEVTYRFIETVTILSESKE